MNDIPAFSLHSWGDVFALMSICSLLLAALIWFLKLEFHNNDHEKRLCKLEEDSAVRRTRRRLLEDDDDK